MVEFAFLAFTSPRTAQAKNLGHRKNFTECTKSFSSSHLQTSLFREQRRLKFSGNTAFFHRHPPSLTLFLPFIQTAYFTSCSSIHNVKLFNLMSRKKDAKRLCRGLSLYHVSFESDECGEG